MHPSSQTRAAAASARGGWEAVGDAIAWRELHTPFPLHETTRPRIRIGLCSSLSIGVLRELVRHVAEAPSAAELSFLEGSAAHVLHAVRRREADVAFVAADRGFEHLESEPLWREPLFAAMAEVHPLASCSEIPAVRLAGETVLVRGGAADQPAEAGAVRRLLGCDPARLICLPVDRETLVELTALGFGVALVAGSSLGAFHPRVIYRPVAGPADGLPFCAVWKPGGSNPALGPFLAMARAAAARLGLRHPAPRRQERP